MTATYNDIVTYIRPTNDALTGLNEALVSLGDRTYNLENPTSPV